MSIDLTGEAEQDWLDGEAPAVKFSELATEEERLSEARDELLGPLGIELRERLSDETVLGTLAHLGVDTDELTEASDSEWLGAADSLLGLLDESDVTGAFESTDTPESGQSNWMSQYLRAVAETIVDNLSKPALYGIAQHVADEDTSPTVTRDDDQMRSTGSEDNQITHSW